jgi:Concanavalin A-like lectin/glucanases superfamily
MMKQLIVITLALTLVSAVASASYMDWQSEYGASGEILYHFNESAGSSADDSSGNVNNGTVGGTADWQVGKFGNALQFDGATSVTAASSTVIDPSQVTLEAWIYLTGLQGRYDLFWEGAYMYFQVGTGSRLEALFFDNGNHVALGHTTVPRDEWVHVAAVYDGTGSTRKVMVFLNGELDGITTYKYQNGTVGGISHIFRIGDNEDTYANGREFLGLMDEVRISATSYGFDPWAEPVASVPSVNWFGEYPPSGEVLYHLDETSGDTAYDSSGNGNDGFVRDLIDPSPEWMEDGKYGGSLWFDRKGVIDNDYALSGDTGTKIQVDLDMYGWKEMTVEAWIYFPPAWIWQHHHDVFEMGGGRVYFMRKFLTPTDQYWPGVGHNANGMVGLVLDGQNRFVASTTSIDGSRGWTHVALTWQSIDNQDGTYGGDLRLYVDGTLEDSSVYASGGAGAIWPAERPRAAAIGGNTWPASMVWPMLREMYGQIDEFRVTNKAIDFEPFPSAAHAIELGKAGVNYFAPSDGWDKGPNKMVLWQEDLVTYPDEFGCKILDGLDLYTVAEAEAAGLISGTLYTFDAATQAYESVPGTGGDFMDGNECYVIWTYKDSLQVLIPLK